MDIFIIVNGQHGYYAEVIVDHDSDGETVVHCTLDHQTRSEAFAAAERWIADMQHSMTSDGIPF